MNQMENLTFTRGKAVPAVVTTVAYWSALQTSQVYNNSMMHKEKHKSIGEALLTLFALLA